MADYETPPVVSYTYVTSDPTEHERSAAASPASVRSLSVMAACLVSSQLSITGITTTADVNCTSINTTDCSTCSPGTYPSNDTESCLCCSSGACINSSDCLPCPTGFYQPQSGQASCLPCPEGFYANATGCSSCSLCPAGQEALGVGSVDCNPCLPGMYKGPGDHRCLYCQNGEYQEDSGADRCDLCPVDHYCPSPDITPISCPEDAFCPSGSTEPSYCMETFMRKVENTCKLAPLTILLLLICAFALCLSVICVVRKRRWMVYRRRMTGFSAKSPLLRPQQKPSSLYGMTYDAEPVYAGW
ncbi:uncharacterized protein PAF06_012127 [Gastrophryne carolinensis]